jgi:LCP family protein required for cell wall assembly
MADQPRDIFPLNYETLAGPREGMHHYLLACVDNWQGNAKNLGNTDGVILATLDTAAKRVMLTTFSREMLIKRPDGGIGRFTYIAKNYGPEALCQTVSTHFGAKVDKYIIFSMDNVQTIIDAMGGVEITIDANEANYLRKYPLSPSQTTPSMGRAGTYLFTGRAAVIYMRIRKADNGGDFMRTQRVRTVLSILADKCRVMTKDQAKALLDSVIENSTTTNMSASDLVAALEQAFALRSCVIEELRLPVDGAYKQIRYAGMSVQDINWNVSRAAMKEYLTRDDGAIVVPDEDEEHYD